MSTIIFEDGTKVNFDGTPTQKDIEEVANQLNLNKQPKQPKKEKGFLRNLAEDITSPFAKVSANVAGAGQHAANIGRLLTGGQVKEVDNKVNLPFWGETEAFGTQGNMARKLKESAGVGLELASFMPAGRAAKTAYQGVRTLGSGFVKPFMREGAIGGGLQGAGEALQRNAGIMETGVSATLGAAGGATASLPFAAGAKVLSTTGRHVVGLVSDKVKVRALTTDLRDSTIKAISPGTKTSAGAGLSLENRQMKGMEVLGSQGRGIEVIDQDGLTKAFDPKTATYSESIQALVKLKNKIYANYATEAQKAKDAGAVIDKSPIVKKLEEISNGPRTTEVKTRAQTLSKELTSIGNDPISVMTYLQDLNNGLTAKILGRSESASRGVDLEVSKLLRAALDDVMQKSNLPEFAASRSDYSSLKAIEDDLVRSSKQNARKLGGGLPDYVEAFAIPEVLVGILTANPGVAGIGLMRSGLASAMRFSRDRQRQLQKALQVGEKLNTLKRSLSSQPK